MENETYAGFKGAEMILHNELPEEGKPVLVLLESPSGSRRWSISWWVANYREGCSGFWMGGDLTFSGSFYRVLGWTDLPEVDG